MKPFFFTPIGSLFFSFLAVSVAASATQWIEVGDEQARHHLQVLVDTGRVDLPLTTWPLPWASVDHALSGLTASTLSDQEAQSYQYLKRRHQLSQQRFSTGQQASLRTSTAGLISYANNTRERGEGSAYIGYAGNQWSAKLQATLIADPIDDQTFRLDGSYLSGNLGNWIVGAGAINRWWGPGWQSGLILSNSARPTPGLFISRLKREPLDLPVFEWLGPWDLQLFLSQLEGNRAVPHAKLFGARFTFRPIQALEIGLSRTSQWGGGGRNEDLSTFGDMLLGRDNRGSGGINEDASNEPGNQLAGIDWRFGHRVAALPTALYGQVIGEDEAGGLPYKFIGMAGIEASFDSRYVHNRIAFEASNTTREFYTDKRSNGAYEHDLYISGYRYKGRPLGYTTDNDTELYLLKGYHYFPHGERVAWTLGNGNFNSDGTDRAEPAGNVFAEHRTDVWYASARYTMPLSQHGELSFGGEYYSNELRLREEPIESNVSISYKTWFGIP